MGSQTPSQTVGPFFAYALTPELYARPGIAGTVLVSDEAAGEHIVLEGRVFDGEGTPIPDAVIEIWQADPEGRYAHPADERSDAKATGFIGFGRAGTDDQGRFSFRTVKPGAVPGPGNAPQAPHVNVVVLMRGLLTHVYTRIYFSDEQAANDLDPVLGLVDAPRRPGLVAERQARHGVVVYSIEIHMQGDRETVFFEA